MRTTFGDMWVIRSSRTGLHFGRIIPTDQPTWRMESKEACQFFNEQDAHEFATRHFLQLNEYYVVEMVVVQVS